MIEKKARENEKRGCSKSYLSFLLPSNMTDFVSKCCPRCRRYLQTNTQTGLPGRAYPRWQSDHSILQNRLFSSVFLLRHQANPPPQAPPSPGTIKAALGAPWQTLRSPHHCEFSAEDLDPFYSSSVQQPHKSRCPSRS